MEPKKEVGDDQDQQVEQKVPPSRWPVAMLQQPRVGETVPDVDPEAEADREDETDDGEWEGGREKENEFYYI